MVHGVGSLAVAAAVAALGAAAAFPSQSAATPTIYVTYNLDCTFSIAVDGGISVTTSAAPGVTLPPGGYQIVVNQAYAESPGSPRCAPSMLQITGPGVAFSAEVGEYDPYDSGPYVFQPSSTYVASVADEPASSNRVFSTAATGSSSSLVTPTTTTTTTASQGEVLPGLVGSAVSSARGTLHATVAGSGKVTLTVHGKQVVSLVAGLYEVAVVDRARSAGLELQKAHGRAVAISGPAFVGKRTVKLHLTVGDWAFYSKAGTKSRFVVVAGAAP
jgi:hypothetical protein